MMAELWPDDARGKGAGLMQCGLGIGFFLASFVWLFVSPSGPNAWRYMYLDRRPAGAADAVDPPRHPGIGAVGEAPTAGGAPRSSASAAAPSLAEHEKLTRFTLFDLFTDRRGAAARRIVLLMSLTTTLGFWGISTWVPPFIGSHRRQGGASAPQWASYAGMA